MSANSDIEWTDATWNPVRGCTKISPGCKHCYAQTFAERFRGVPGHPYQQGFDLRLVPAKVAEPIRWTSPKTVFVNSMSDLFHDAVPEGYIEQIMRVMEMADWHTYQVLTKRAVRMADLLQHKFHFAANLGQVWWGVSVENKRHGLPRIDVLRDTPAKVRFLSIEPLLEDLGRINLSGIDWVIVGGESGNGARAMQQAWVTSIREQCRAANVPFFFKQWGGVRKGEAGRRLEGRTFDEMPERLSRSVPSQQKRAAMIERVNAGLAAVVAGSDCSSILFGKMSDNRGVSVPSAQKNFRYRAVTRAHTAELCSSAEQESPVLRIDASVLSMGTSSEEPAQ